MQDVKSLYHAAKSSGHPKDISAYAECVRDLYEHNPANYISNLEYIISSDIGLKTFNGFVEKYGLPIGVYDSVMECVDNCIDRCGDAGLDYREYTELKKWLEGYKQKYRNCFSMYEFYCDTNDEEFIKTYYGMNDKGVQNNRLIKGMIEKFNEMAIPDVLITSDRIGTSAVKQTLAYLGGLYNMGNCTYAELAAMPETMARFSYLAEAVQDLGTSTPTMEYLRQIYPYTYQLNVYRIHLRQNKSYQESMMTGDGSTLYEYSQFDIDVIKGLIEFNERKMTCMDDPNERMRLQNEIYSLYESLDGYITESGDTVEDTSEVDESYVGTKHTGSIPTYLSKHHDMAYGGEDTTDDVEKYRRKSATAASEPDKPKSDPISDDTTVEPSAINPVDNPTDIPTPEEQKAINNYYYTYTNSNNQNTNSFNRHHTSNDDHSANKRIHSDNINGKDDTERIVSEQLDNALLETIEGRLIESLGEIIQADDFYTEASGDKKFKYAYKSAYNYANGHALKITYSLDPITITNVGDLKPLRDEAFSIIKKYVDDATKGGKISGLTSKLKLIKGILGIKENAKDRKKWIVELLNQHIKDIGYVDFQAKDCKVVEIYDRADKKRLKDDVQVVGIYAAADYNKEHSLVLSAYAYDRMKRRVESRHSNFRVSTIKVGSIQETPTFMTTHWDDHADHGLVDSNGQLIKDDGQDRDNSALIQTAREAHGYDLHQDDVKLTDALVDFIDPIKNIAFMKGRKKSGEFETQISNYLISEQNKLVESLEKAITIVDDPNDSSELQKMLSAESDKLNSAKKALKTNDHETIFNTLEHLEDSVKQFDNIIRPLSKKYSKLLHIMSQFNLNESAASVDSMFDLRIDRILARDSIMMEAVGDADDNKPESDHPIKDTFTDIDRVTTRMQQQAKKKVQDIENAGRAIAKPVKRTQEWMSNMIGRWKDADETKIKERLADPHERSGIMNAIKAAIKYGSLAKAGLLLNPVIMFLTATRFIGKNKKMQRIRNEMIGELKTEIDILDEKIKDAASNNDLKAKYQMMRFRNELNKKLIRVGGTKRERKVI